MEPAGRQGPAEASAALAMLAVEAAGLEAVAVMARAMEGAKVLVVAAASAGAVMEEPVVARDTAPLEGEAAQVASLDTAAKAGLESEEEMAAFHSGLRRNRRSLFQDRSQRTLRAALHRRKSRRSPKRAARCTHCCISSPVAAEVREKVMATVAVPTGEAGPREEPRAVLEAAMGEVRSEGHSHNLHSPCPMRTLKIVLMGRRRHTSRLNPMLRPRNHCRR